MEMEILKDNLNEKLRRLDYSKQGPDEWKPLLTARDVLEWLMHAALLDSFTVTGSNSMVHIHQATRNNNRYHDKSQWKSFQ
jgi:hypothetical protein